MDHSTHMPLSAAEMTESNLVGAQIYDDMDENVGKISHLHHSAAAPKVVVDVGGFLGIGAKPVLLDLDELTMMRDSNGTVHGITRLSQAELEVLPEHLD